MSTRAFNTGVSGTELTATEREFIRGMRPWGFILFKRNVEAPDQVSGLVDELRNCLGEADAPVPIDPEGARAVTEGLEQGGVLPILKHIPGHGRAAADSHFRLPAVDTSKQELERTDFAAFQPLADLPMAMTAHVVFSALHPAHPATTSATIIRQVIRGVIGFQGLLMSDDVSMNALAGSIAERTRAIVNAGCDMVLHCNGKLDEMRDVARETPELAGEALDRARRALALRRKPEPFDRRAARAELDALTDRVGTA
jgi:beta-N-acetylhexosaminidase